MSEQTRVRQKTTPRLGILEWLPQELLELVLSSLDVRSLCTARLVCKPFLYAASRWIRSIRVRAEDLHDNSDSNFNNFPCLSRVDILGVEPWDDDLLAQLAQPHVAEAVTHLSLHRSAKHATFPLPTLPPLPGLRSLQVGRFGLDNSFFFPETLQELSLWDPISGQNRDPLTRLTRLTSLDLSVQEHGNQVFEGLTTLTALHRLQIEGTPSILPCVGALTLLTHLDWECARCDVEGQVFDFEPLTRLQKLVHLRVRGWDLELGPEQVRRIGQISSLRSLDLDIQGPRLLDLDATLLAPLSRLTSLRQRYCCMDGRSLQRLNIEGLRDLALGDAAKLGGAALAFPILQRATGLESLEFRWDKYSDHELESGQMGAALARMPRLQSLIIDAGMLVGEPSFAAIRHLTRLTQLEWWGGNVSNADVAACAGLKKLRSLTIIPRFFAPCGPVTLEVLHAVGMLPELTSLALGKQLGIWGDRTTAEIRARFNVERHRRGWPPLCLCFPGKTET